MASPQLQKLADSAGMRLAQFLVQACLIPAIGWYGTKVADRLERVETFIVVSGRDYAVLKRDLDYVMSLIPQRTLELAKLNDKVVELQIEMSLVKGRR